MSFVESSGAGYPNYPAPVEDQLAPTVNRFMGDDWTYTIVFKTSGGSPIDMSSYTFTSSLIIENPNYTTYAISGANGSVGASQAVIGIITVNVARVLTATIPYDVDSVAVPTSWQSIYNTRLALMGAAGSAILTRVIIPTRVIRQ